MWKKFVHEYLSFSKNQRRGLYFLLAIILFCMIASFFLPYLLSDKEEQQKKAEFRAAVTSFLAKQKAVDTEEASYELFYFNPNDLSLEGWRKLGVSDKIAHTIQHYLETGARFSDKEDLKKIYGFSNKTYQRLLPYIKIKDERNMQVKEKGNKTFQLFPFNPNKLSVEGWQKLGLSEHVARVIQHYRNAAGSFSDKEDLKNIYGLSEEEYNRLKPYIRIAAKDSVNTKQRVNSSKSKNKKHEVKPLMLDINVADSADWTKLYGIGSVFAGRIIHFREALGGFYSISQIKEVYGLPDSNFQQIKSHLRISNEAGFKQINLNKTDLKTLSGHPYISYHLAKAVIAFRKQHGKYKSVDAVKEIKLITPQIFQKIKPYLTVEE